MRMLTDLIFKKEKVKIRNYVGEIPSFKTQCKLNQLIGLEATFGLWATLVRPQVRDLRNDLSCHILSRERTTSRKSGYCSCKTQRRKLFLTSLWKNLYIELSSVTTLTPIYCHFSGFSWQLANLFKARKKGVTCYILTITASP